MYDDYMLTYHVTPSANVAAILRDGLIPAIGGRSAELGETVHAVYLFPDEATMEDALGNWLGECFDEDEPLTILAVDITGLPVVEGAGFEILVPVPIDPARITVTKTA